MLSEFDVEIADPDGTIEREYLGVSTPSPFHAAVVSRPRPGDGNADVPTEFYVHQQWVGHGMRHDIEIHNTARDTIERTVRLHFDADFAHLFEVKAGQRRDADAALVWDAPAGVGQGRLDATTADCSVEIRTRPSPTDVDREQHALTWRLSCAPDSTTTVSITFEPCWSGRPAGLDFPLDVDPGDTDDACRLRAWRDAAPRVDSPGPRIEIAVECTVADLAALRIFEDDQDPDAGIAVAAGAPWFMTVFGRDSLLTSWMIMPFLPGIALGTLDRLADLQGTKDVPETEEQPGKIMHELRQHSDNPAFSHDGLYYGTVDATPLYVMVAAEARRWGQLDDAGIACRDGRASAPPSSGCVEVSPTITSGSSATSAVPTSG